MIKFFYLIISPCIIIGLALACIKTENAENIYSVNHKNQISDTCNDPDRDDINCHFEYMPENVSAYLKIADDTVSGNRIIIKSRLLKSDGKTPIPNAIIFHYHTDKYGYYPKNGKEKGIHKWTGYLHGWNKTDENGYFEIHTIRPAQYPSNDFPAHIHSVVKINPDTKAFYINDYVFKDDPLVSEKYTGNLNFQGGNGIVEFDSDSSGVLIGKRDIILNKIN